MAALQAAILVPLRALMAVAGACGLVALVPGFFLPLWYVDRLRAGLDGAATRAG